MKKFIAMIMVIAMVAAFIPTTLAKSDDATGAQTLDKSKYDIPDAYQMYGVDNNGNMTAAGSSRRTTTGTDLSNVMAAQEKAQTKSDTKGFADSTHYGVGLWDQSVSLSQGYNMTNDDFTESNDFFTSKAKSYSMFFSPADVSPEESNLVESTGIMRFNKGDRFWFNFDIISGYGSQGPNYYLDEDGNKAYIPYSIYMYSGNASDWDSEIGVKSLELTSYWQGLTRISTQITVPAANQVYVFAVVVEDSVVQDYGLRGFQGWLCISDFEKTYKEAKVDSTIETNKQYTADLGDTDMLLLYGDDIGNVVANGVLYKIELKAGQRWALRAEGDGTIGGRLYFLDENKDLIANNYLGTGAVTGADSYKTLTTPIFPPVDGTYYILVAGFMYDDDGKMDFEIIDYNEAQQQNEYLSYMPEIEDQVIDLDTFGEEQVIETVDGVDVWGYFWDSSLGMGILAIVCPGTYKIIGEKEDMMLDLYDSVTVDLDNAKVATVLCNGIWGPVTVNSTGKSTISDNFYGMALVNYEGCYSSIYLTGDDLTIAGEKSNGALVEVPLHVLTKTLTASATSVSGSFTVALWVMGWNTPSLTFGRNTVLKDASGKDLKQATLYFDTDNYYKFGYTVSQYATLHRYTSPDFYQIADYFVATTDGAQPTPPISGEPTPPVSGEPTAPIDSTKLGDANCDGKLNTGDATAVLKHAASIAILEGQGLTNADINKDSKVNTGDATMILKVVAGLIADPNN